jgi:hypothetical protein
MAKKHKHSNNGVALDTALSVADLRAVCAQAAVESTGDLWNGSHKVVEAEQGDSWSLYVVKGSLTGWNKFMTFMVNFNSVGGRSTLQTEIISYSTTQTTLMYFIPVSPKKMVARHTYLQFVNKVANTVKLADQSARIALSEGEWMQAAALPSAGTAPAPATAPVTSPVAAGPTLPLPPPPPPQVQRSVVIAPPVETSLPTHPSETDVVDDGTQKVPRKARSAHWRVTPQGLASVPLVSSLVIGRQPSGANEGAFVTVPRSEDTVSKRHVMFELVDGVVHVTDLGSANGTILVGPADELIDCEPNTPTPVPAGYTIELGDFVVTLDAPAGAST